MLTKKGRDLIINVHVKWLQILKMRLAIKVEKIINFDLAIKKCSIMILLL